MQPKPLRRRDLSLLHERGKWPAPFEKVRRCVEFESHQTYTRLPWFSPLSEEDLQQEAWMKAWQLRERFQSKRGYAFTTLLVRSLRNRLADVLTHEWRKKKMKPVELDSSMSFDRGGEDRAWAELSRDLHLELADRRVRGAFIKVRMGIRQSRRSSEVRLLKDRYDRYMKEAHHGA